VKEAKNGGKACGEKVKSKTCNDGECPVNCEGKWDEEWSKCDCDTAKRSKEYTVTK